MTRCYLAIASLILCAASISAAPNLKERKDDDATRILGEWVVESISVHGGVPSASNSTMRFGKDGTCGITNQGGKEMPAVYSMEGKGTPRRMQWLNGPDRTEWLCLYEFKDDSLKVAFVNRGMEAPDRIEPMANLTIYYLRKVK